jgi:VCBS repeat protein
LKARFHLPAAARVGPDRQHTMNRRHSFSLILVLLMAVLGACAGITHPSPGSQIIVADLNHDGRTERVMLNPGRDPALTVWRGGRRLWQGVPRHWQPWKLKIADLDGDGRREIIVGVQKSTHFFPHPHHCLFIYRFDGRTVQPIWLGSSLSQPFIDFAFAKREHGAADRLIAVEITREGRRCVTAYSWNGFGFTADWQRGSWKTARLLEPSAGMVLLEADSRRIPVREGAP